MDDLDLARRLKRLKRTVLMFQSELHQEHLDAELLADIDVQLERGIATDPRGSALRDHVDDLRENALIPRKELFADCIRASEKLMLAIEGILERLG